MSRSGLVVPNIFANEGSGPVAVSQIDTNFSTASGWLADSSNGYGYWLQDSGTANNYIVTYPAGLAPSSLTPGFWFVMNPSNGNSGSSVVTINSLPATSISNPAGLALTGGEINVNTALTLMYTGVGFIILGPCPLMKSFGNVTTNQSLNCAGYTSVFVSIGVQASLILTLSNLGSGVNFGLITSTASSVNLNLAATSPSGVSYTFSFILGANSVLGGVIPLSNGSFGASALTSFFPPSSYTLQGIAI